MKIFYNMKEFCDHLSKLFKRVTPIAGKGIKIEDTDNGKRISCTIEPVNRGGIGTREDNGYFKVIDASTTDPETGITTPKVAIVDSNEVNPLTAQYCGYIQYNIAYPVATVTSLVCAQKITPITNPITYEDYNILGGYVTLGIDSTDGTIKPIIDFEDWHSELWSVDIMNGRPIQRFRIAKITLQKTMINELESWSIREIIQLHQGYVFAQYQPKNASEWFCVKDVYPEDFNPVTYRLPAAGEDRTVKIVSGWYDSYQTAGIIILNSNKIYAETGTIIFTERSSGVTRIYVRIYYDAGYKYEYKYYQGTATDIPLEHPADVNIELAQVQISRPPFQVQKGQIDLTPTYWL